MTQQAENQMPSDMEWVSTEQESTVDNQEVEQKQEVETETGSEVEAGGDSETEAATETETEESDEFVFEMDGQKSESPTDEEESEDAPQWVKALRAKQREQAAEIKALKAERDALKNEGQTHQVKEREIPPMPNLYDFDTDEAHAEAVNNWLKERDEIISSNNEVKRQQQQQEESHKQVYQQKLESYAQRRQEVVKQIPDYQQKEAILVETLPMQLQNEIISETSKPAEVAYALASNPELMQKYMNEPSPVKRGIMLGNIEKGANFVSKKNKPANPTPRKPQGQGPAVKPKSELHKVFPDAVIK